MIENYYEILEVEETSTQEDIKKAYRRLVMKFHPDKNKDTNAKDAFESVGKAYSILSDLKKKESYDLSIKKDAECPKPKTMKIGADLRFSIKVKIADLIKGCKKVVPIKRKGQCSSCDGTGSANKKTKKCNYCNGTGLQGLPLILGQKKKCTYCGGVGQKPQEKSCATCKGLGLVTELIRHEITLNPFSYIITVPGMGDYPMGYGKPGDLLIELNIEQHPHYKIKGLNISGVVGISPAQAVIGDEISLSVFDRPTRIVIPPGTQHNDVIEQENGGISYEGKTGIFKATVKILMPDIITEEEKSLYNQLLSFEKGTEIWPKALSF